MLTVTHKQDGSHVTAFVSGKVDSTNSGDFESGLASVDTGSSLTIDVEKLEYISSAGLRVILKFRKAHADLEIVNASTEVYEIFDMTGFTEMINIKRAYKSVSVEGCEIIGRGANGNVYRIDPDTVVKVYKHADSLDAIEHERDLARKALVLGIPTAISYDIVKVGENFASMFELINAKSFSNLLAEHPENVLEITKRSIDLLKLIHSTEVPAGQLPDQRLKLFGWLKDLENELPADVYAKLTKLAEAIPQDNHMIHGDFHTKNLMLQNDEVIMIDMDTLAVGHPVLEMAAMYNVYIAFQVFDKPGTLEFLGYDYDVGLAIWRNSLKLYYGIEDEKEVDYRENQAKTIGLIKLLRRSIKRKNHPEFIPYCKEELSRLANELDSLT